MQFKYAEIGDIVYHWFAANLTTGEAGDGASPIFYVRKAGEAAASAPIGTGTPTLLSAATYASGLYEIALNTAASGAGEYATFCSLLISSVNPVGFVGSVKLRAVGTGALDTNVVYWKGAAAPAMTGDAYASIATLPTAASIKTTIEAAGSSLASILQDTDATIPATLATLAPASSALSTATWTNTKAGYLDAAISGATAPTAAAVATAVWDAPLAPHLAAGSAGAALSSATAPSANDVATAVWDGVLAAHLAVGSTGEALNAAGAAGDPWNTALPGAYIAGKAGYMISKIATDTASIETRIPTALTTHGYMKSSLMEILSTVLGETATGYLAAAFKWFFDVAVPTVTVAEVMSISAVGLANQALFMLGQKSIISMTEDSEAARLCNGRYAYNRDATLRSYPWNCAMARATLALSGTAPIWGYDHKYALPTVPLCLRVLSMEESYKWKVEGRFLATDADTCNILYIAQVTDVTEMEVLLREAIAARLAADICFALTGSSTQQDKMWAIYEQKIRQAKSIDAQEGTPEDITDDTFNDSRY
jgi:hypothetical protein